MRLTGATSIDQNRTGRRPTATVLQSPKTLDGTMNADHLHVPTPNRAARRSAARRARKVAALGSSAVLAGGAGAMVTSLLSAAPAGALTTHQVTQLGDAGDGTCDVTCTLRDAADDSANDGDDSAITFAPSVTGTITLTTGDIDFGGGTDAGNDLTITGPGSGALTVRNDGTTLDRVFDFNEDMGNVAISGLTITNGSSTSDGGGIRFYSGLDLSLTDVVLTANKATGSARGGGLAMYNSGNLTIADSTISLNTTNNRSGGGAWLYGIGDLHVTNTTVSGNTGSAGGGIDFYQSADATIIGSTFYDNTGRFGGGFKLYDAGDLVVDSSTFNKNTTTSGTGAGIMFYQGNNAHDGDTVSATITNSTISGNTADDGGAGIRFYDGPDPKTVTTTLTILGSTISGNTAGTDNSGQGGGLYFTGDTLVVGNSTFHGNSTTSDGGGIAAAFGDVSLLQTTISGNTAGPDSGDVADGLYLYSATAGPPVRTDVPDLTKPAVARSSEHADKPDKPAKVKSQGKVGAQDFGTVELIGTIISGNGDTDIDTGGDGVTADLTSSLWGTKGAGITINDLGGNINSANPGLGALADNGGPTLTMALLPGSAAIDAGPTTVPSFAGNEFDQRGAGFPRVINGRVDIGAFEFSLVVRFTG